MRKNRVFEILAAVLLIAVFASVLKTDRGFYTECAPQEGYLGSVTVFDSDGEAVYKWFSASGYILSADVSDNGKYLAVACEKDGRGSVHVFRTDSTDESGCFDSDEIVVAVGYLGNRLCALTEHGVYMLSNMGNTKRRVKLNGVLGDYDFSDGKLRLCIQSHMSGGEIKKLSFG